jgi:signal transduction histidine kinase
MRSPVQGDREKLLWALTHLLENAIKFTAAGGRIMLGLKPESTNLVMVSVRDTGIGIAPQHLQEIFEPFKQLDASARRRTGGTGLGLALVRQIVEAHGSILRAAEGRGRLFPPWPQSGRQRQEGRREHPRRWCSALLPPAQSRQKGIP